MATTNLHELLPQAEAAASSVPDTKVIPAYSEKQKVDEANKRAAQSQQAMEVVNKTSTALAIERINDEQEVRNMGARIQDKLQSFVDQQLTVTEEANTPIDEAITQNQRALVNNMRAKERIDAQNVGFFNNPLKWVANTVQRSSLDKKIARDTNDLAALINTRNRNHQIASTNIQEYQAKTITPELIKLQRFAEDGKSELDRYSEQIAGMQADISLSLSGQQQQETIYHGTGGGGLSFGSGANSKVTAGEIFLTQSQSPYNVPGDEFDLRGAKEQIKNWKDPNKAAQWEILSQKLIDINAQRKKNGEPPLDKELTTQIVAETSMTNLVTWGEITNDKELLEFAATADKAAMADAESKEIRRWKTDPAHFPRDVNGNVIDVGPDGLPKKVPEPSAAEMKVIRANARKRVDAMKPKELVGTALNRRASDAANKNFNNNVQWYVPGLAVFRDEGNLPDGSDSYPAQLRARGVPEYVINVLRSEDAKNLPSMGTRGRQTAGNFIVNLTQLLVENMLKNEPKMDARRAGVEAARIVSDWGVHTQDTILMQEMPEVVTAKRFGVDPEFTTSFNGKPVKGRPILEVDLQSRQKTPAGKTITKPVLNSFNIEDPTTIYNVWYKIYGQGR